MENKIVIKGARENNLKNVDLEIPKNKLVVFTGLSGSGKSSLAFATIYAEGRRRYIESLSAYARQFLGGNEKPDVDSIEGLSPAISIDQKTTSHNPRSTVGTVTEIYDYLRLLYARVGTPYCINGHGQIHAATIKEIINNIKSTTEDNEQVYVLSPVVRDKKGTHKDLLAKLLAEGFIRVSINGEIKMLEEEIILDKNQRHNIDIVVDRLIYHNDDEVHSRLFSAIEIALQYSNSLVKIKYPETENKEDNLFSNSYSCNVCGFNIPELEPRLFSFNAPLGACGDCDGLGVRLVSDPELIIPDKSLSINQGGVVYFKNFLNTDNLEWQKFKILCDYYYIDMNLPIDQLTNKQIKAILRGSEEQIEIKLLSSSGRRYDSYDFVEGVADLIQRRYFETKSEEIRKWYTKFMSSSVCQSCDGARLNPTALSIKIADKNIFDFTKMSIQDELEFILNVELTQTQAQIANLVLTEITNRISFLNEVGLGYLDLARTATTLSGGEAQRIRLAKQIGSQLTGILYVLDEPSIGLHQRDNDKLIKTLKHLRDLGNTLIVVEHDEDTMKTADWIVDVGPQAGEHGGQITFSGTYDEILKSDTITGRYLSGKESIPVPKKRRSGNGQKIDIVGARENNLKNVNVSIPLNKFIAITGVSGSGKSTLLEDIIYKGIRKNLARETIVTGKFSKMNGLENIDKVIFISQEPIGKTPRSNPATYTGVFDDIRDLFTNLPEAKIRGYKKGRFSFNVPGGRCEHCFGDGVITISMQFMPSVEVVCEICEGKRYNDETLQVKFKEKTIADVLNMTVETAAAFFENIPSIKDKLDTILEVGLGYIRLGQSATTLSGGEAQRIKLSTYLLKKQTGKTMFLLDEPTTGLHIDDVKRLVHVLNKLVDLGNTVVAIEHNLDFIKVADHVIDLGPEGGIGGGLIVAAGTPEQVADTKGSYTGTYLKEYLYNDFSR
ncbi:excinuclease ABC subunit A [Mesoplasma florum]|uniref:excinuclease ABC subunit UvrA n=1 Tax=Mesoplasma florum TaxID=2151 RepID=UPI000BE29AD0|nr:excinuclease ABC subunit UvrA [Mesoplasma florum]ATI73016.1 excinuclease ABC subunit A [Mesoplasma florum]ATI73705.1 excinuclease ABC subunit A [Mesoplasma florum]AVN58670.1 excinuclease ABC subunit A [Mesoplasma florum]AVN60742.1 excinuclease ABC subunit A [Mesoplasma florum]AVN64805.1 excinuclease ABC subunit A [Mesoplasma florum]